MRHNPILRQTSHLLIPAILLFALYVQFHGEYGAGGGFQAGVIFAAGIILYALIYGLQRAQRIVRPAIIRTCISLGVLIYAGVGVISLFMGGLYLDYNVLAHDPVHGQHLGILLVELGVGITVAAVMIGVFYAFAGRDFTGAGNHKKNPPQSPFYKGGRKNIPPFEKGGPGGI